MKIQVIKKVKVFEWTLKAGCMRICERKRGGFEAGSKEFEDLPLTKLNCHAPTRKGRHVAIAACPSVGPGFQAPSKDSQDI